MAISSSDFRRIFIEIGRKYDIAGMNSYVNTVIEDFEFYVESEKASNVQQESSSTAQYFQIPERYSSYQFEYFVLYYFDQFFLSSVRMKDQISVDFSKLTDSVNYVGLYNDKHTEDTIQLNTEEYSTNYRVLLKLLEEVGNSILPDLFRLDDFISTE